MSGGGGVQSNSAYKGSAAAHRPMTAEEPNERREGGWAVMLNGTAQCPRNLPIKNADSGAAVEQHGLELKANTKDC
jgi:hypothetical protein